MCGIVGFFQLANAEGTALRATVGSMSDRLYHRGPDDSGVWVDAEAGIALGHRRLSIIDLSPAGHQPMHSRCGRYILVFNGEIYNHLELRKALSGRIDLDPDKGKVLWRGHSDTETLLTGIACWGLEATLNRLVGMFAFALWDRQTRTLTLVRDRFGEKPLYYGWIGKGDNRTFVFGSELKALRSHPAFDSPLNRTALSQFMRYMFVPAPNSIYENVYKLEPGCLLTTQDLLSCSPPTQALKPGERHETSSMIRWWSLENSIINSRQTPFTDEYEALSVLEQQLRESVRLQALADVPLGAFLSGGVDSSLIVALMQDQANHNGSAPVKTFTIGLEESAFDESSFAFAVSQHLGTDHTNLIVKATEAQSIITNLPEMYDEPFADSSQIPTHLVCMTARKEVTVALSGDAGDELFGGYNRYIWGPRIWNRLSQMPFSFRNMMGSVIRSLPIDALDTLGNSFNQILPGLLGISRLGYKANKLANKLSYIKTKADLYQSLVSEWENPSQVVKCNRNLIAGDRDLYFDNIRGLSDFEQFMYYDTIHYLPNDILCKIDRASMAISLETRVPFLDHRVAEIAWRLPSHMKIRGNTGKWALRQILYKYVPKALIDRPKTGFSIPIGQWLVGPLRDWAEELLNERNMELDGFLHPKPIRKRWEEHLNRRSDHSSSLWAVLMFQSWVQAQKK
jgi:asparagine synthase (glutamine-hydrolysing)